MIKMTSFLCALLQYWIVPQLLLIIVDVGQAADFSFPNTTLTKLAFGSCHKSEYANIELNIWKTIQRVVDPQLWLWVGDAVYVKGRRVATLDQLRGKYQEMINNASIGYQSFKPPLGVFGTWDDHDYGANDAGYELSNKNERAELFWEFLGQQRPKPHRDGVYSSITIGIPPRQVKIILLDTRWNRDKHCIPSLATKIPLGAGLACLTRWVTAGLIPHWCESTESTILGLKQWEWLEQELSITKEENPSLILVVSSVQVLTTNPTMEGWGHYPSERKRLIQLLSQLAERTSVFVLSGDVHHAEILDPMPSKIDSFLEITSSGLTHDCSDPFYGFLCRPLLDTFYIHRHSHPQNFFIGKNYGSVAIDWEVPSVQVNVHDTNGAIVLSTGWYSLTPPHTAWTAGEHEQVHPCMDGHLVGRFNTVMISSLLATVLIWIIRGCK